MARLTATTAALHSSAFIVLAIEAVAVALIVVALRWRRNRRGGK